VIRALAAAFLALLFLPRAVLAVELWRSGDAYLDVGGYVRVLGLYTRGTDQTDFGNVFVSDPDCASASTFTKCSAFNLVGQRDVLELLTRLRAEIVFRLDTHWSARVEYDQEVLVGGLDTFEAGLSDGLATESLLGAEGILAGSPEKGVVYQHRLYRGYLQFESEHFDAIVGRQRINWGVGRLWKPLDRFQFVPPLAIESDQIPGIDAIEARWLIDGFDFLEGVAAPSRTARDSAYAMRFRGVFRDIDYSLVVGSFQQSLTFGFDLAGNLLDAAARFEFAFSYPLREVWPVGNTKPEQLDPYVQLVGSIDYLFDVGTGIYVLLEHLYNGNALGFGSGVPGPLLPLFATTPAGGVQGASNAIFGGSQVVTRSHSITGLSFAYDITPEVRGELLSLYDWQGASAAFSPRILYTPLSWLEVSIGGQIFVGPRLSEFGAAENIAFFLAEAFF